MNKELLEKMQWLYEQGFKPDLWYLPDQYSDLDPRILEYKEELNFTRPMPVDFNMPCRKSYPYFTESTLWDLLKPITYKKDVYGERDFYFRDLHFVYSEIYEGEYKDEDQPYKVDKSLLEHLLDLTIWAVKEGYLKAGVKSE